MTGQKSALDGLRIIDLSRVLGGPSCTQILGDHGADVIKVEPPGGDETREWGPPFVERDNGEKGASSYFTGINRNKRGMAINLSLKEGQDVLLKLLEEADVLIENFKSGTLERWGLGYDTYLKKKFPHLIYCRITGFGADGPLGGFPGYDAAVQAMTGLFSVNGAPETNPTRIGIPIVDLGTGLNAVIGICMAIIERQRSGLGQMIDITLYDTGVSLMFPHGANWFLDGKLPERVGNAHTNVVPYDLFETATQPIFLAIGNNRQFKKALAILGHPGVADDSRFSTNGARSENREILTAELQALIIKEDGDVLTQKFLEGGVPSGPALDVKAVLNHAHTKHRKMIYEKDNYRGLAAPVKLSRTPARMRKAPPEFSADSNSVLVELGYSQKEIASLVSSGVIILEKE